MRVSVTLVDPRWDLREDVLVDSDDATPLREVAEELLSVLAAPQSQDAEVVSLASRRAPVTVRDAPRALFHHGRPLDLDRTLGESGLTEGALLSVGDPSASYLGEPDGLVEVRQVSGRGAGAVHRLVVGEATIGSDPACVIPLPDPRLPAVVATVSVAADGTVEVTPFDGAAEALETTFPYQERPLALDRHALTETSPWPAGAQLTVAGFLLELEDVVDPDAAV